MTRTTSRAFARPVLAALALAASAGAAEATQVTVNGETYNLSFFNGSYNDNIDKFNTTMMPWWGDISLAGKFATEIGNSGSTISEGTVSKFFW